MNSMGDVYMLLPNAGQELSGFLRQGRLSANNSVLIPDSLNDQNAAGFHYDYSPPGGTDRVVAVCFSDYADAERFQAQVTKLESGGTLDAGLFAVASRGVTNVTPSLGPAQPAAQPAVQPQPATQSQPVRPAPATAGTAGGWATAKLSLTVGNDQ